MACEIFLTVKEPVVVFFWMVVAREDNGVRRGLKNSYFFLPRIPMVFQAGILTECQALVFHLT